MRLRRTKDISAVLIMHAKCLPGDDYEPADQHWLLRDEGGRDSGFCSATMLADGETVYLTRAGLLPRARGQGLQRRMIRARLRWARERGATCAITYVSLENCASANNLVREGFQMYRPEYAWVGDEVIYFHRAL